MIKMNRTSYIGNLATKVALGATLLFSIPSTNANGGSPIYPKSTNEILEGIEQRLQAIESQQIKQQRDLEKLREDCIPRLYRDTAGIVMGTLASGSILGFGYLLGMWVGKHYKKNGSK